MRKYTGVKGPFSNGDYWQCSYIDGQGKEVKPSLGAKAKVSERNARAMCRGMEAKFAKDPATLKAGQAPPLIQWCTRYLSHRTNLAESTIKADTRTCAYLREFFGDAKPLDEITPAHAADWRAWLGSSERQPGWPSEGKGQGESTVCYHIRHAKGMFNAAAEQEVIPANPFRKQVGAGPEIERNDAPLSRADIAKLVEAAGESGPGWKALVALCAYAGLRLNEALRITWSCVDFNGNKINVPVKMRDGRTSGARTTKSKGRAPLMVPELAVVLRECRAGTTPGDVVAPVSLNNLNRMMVGYKGSGKTPATTGIIRRAGLAPWPRPFHRLRDWRADMWRQEGIEERVIDLWMGHSLAVARKHYARTVPEGYYTNGRLTREQELERQVQELKAKLSASAA